MDKKQTITTERKIGKITYLVQALPSEKATDTIHKKIEKLIVKDLQKKPGNPGFQTVDKLGVGDYAQHHFSFKTSFLFIFFKINKNLAVFQPRFSRIFASFFKFMHAKVSPAFISIRAFPTYCVYRNPCCSFAVPKIRSMVSFLNW